MSNPKAITGRFSPELHDALGRATFEKNLSQNAILILGVEAWIKENSPLVYEEYLSNIELKHKKQSKSE